MELLAREARRRREVFEHLEEYLEKLVETIRSLDSGAEVYLFGSVAEGKYTYSSDIDVLVVTDKRPEEVISMLWSRGIEDPFEIHVVTKDMLENYKRRTKLVKIA